MHIYDKQCEIMQKNQWKSPNSQIQCFYNGTSVLLTQELCAENAKKTQKLEKLKRKLLMTYLGCYHVEGHVQSIPKMW